MCDVIHCVCQWPLLFRQHLYFYLFIIQIENDCTCNATHTSQPTARLYTSHLSTTSPIPVPEAVPSQTRPATVPAAVT